VLQRFTEYDLDQFGNCRFDTSCGPVFVQLARERQPGVPAEAFTSLTGPGPGATGRIAHVSDSNPRPPAPKSAPPGRQTQPGVAGCGVEVRQCTPAVA
jgi:hypothetical protein